MSKSLNSPTARLLQSSRLFSLPRPLPQPALETATSTGVYRASESATLPYPTYQAIATPASSRFRGDWGLKRALPKKSTRSSNPHIRVKAHDNFAHITDFESAADHTQTEAKWRQMGVPMVVREKRETYSNDRATYSAYDDHIDNTDPEAGLPETWSDSQKSTRRPATEPMQRQRWKYDSPFLAAMQEGEFDIYVQSRLESRRAEFREFMIQRLLQQRMQDEERRLRDMGQRRMLSPAQKSSILGDIIANYDAEEKRLRDDHAVQHLASDLTAAICEFLDLPGVRESAEFQSSAHTDRLKNLTAGIVSETAAPPSTHPAAGLSHLRSNAIMENHPFWGPQAYASPVLSRVITPRNSAFGSDSQAKLGVGGVIASDPVSNSYSGKGAQPARFAQPLGEDVEPEQHHLDAERMVHALEVDLPGGNKVWVHPETASVDEQGRIRLRLGRGDKESIAVARNDVQAILDAKSAASRSPGAMSPPRGTPGNANYGYSLPDRRYAAPRSKVEGFDGELGSWPRQGRSKDRESEALDRIKGLADSFKR